MPYLWLVGWLNQGETLKACLGLVEFTVQGVNQAASQRIRGSLAGMVAILLI